MRIFQLFLSHNGMDDSFYFENPPTKQDCLDAISNHEKLAGEAYNWLYAGFRQMIEELHNGQDKYSARPSHTSRLRHTGGPCMSGTYQFSSYDVVRNK